MRRNTQEPAKKFPEFVVRREHFNRYFENGLPRSTFHDLVNKGRIVPFKGMRGLYLLNESLKKLGLKEVPKLPGEPESRSQEDILRLAFTLIDPALFPAPSWLLGVEAIDIKDADHARLLADQYRDAVEGCDRVELKMAYFQGLIDAAFMVERDNAEA